jgi:hypothetical protein
VKPPDLALRGYVAADEEAAIVTPVWSTPGDTRGIGDALIEEGADRLDIGIWVEMALTSLLKAPPGGTESARDETDFVPLVPRPPDALPEFRHPFRHPAALQSVADATASLIQLDGCAG